MDADFAQYQQGFQDGVDASNKEICKEILEAIDKLRNDGVTAEQILLCVSDGLKSALELLDGDHLPILLCEVRPEV